MQCHYYSVTEFTPGEPNREFWPGALELLFSFVENDALVLNLLTLVGKRLYSTELLSNGERDVRVDLGDVAAACPGLLFLRIKGFEVSVSGHGKALRTWGLQTMTIKGSIAIDELEYYLSNRSHQMSTNLCSVSLSPAKGRTMDQVFSWQQIMALESHNGDSLPLVKERLPIDSKVAMISVINAGIVLASFTMHHYLDAHVLSVIFKFAATARQRSVRVG